MSLGASPDDEQDWKMTYSTRKTSIFSSGADGVTTRSSLTLDVPFLLSEIGVES